MALKYTTLLKLGNILGIVAEVPSFTVGSTATNEAVGTGDGSNVTFYLDQKNIVPTTYTLYANAVAMTDVTHYVLDTDTGIITLTTAGKTTLASNDLTAKYKYFNNGMVTSYISNVLYRSEKEMENTLNTIFTDGTADNPTYTSTTEIQPSEGLWQDRYIVSKKPLIDVSSTLDGDHAVDATTVDVAAGDGSNFPEAGYIIIGSEVIQYTGITTDQLTGVTRGKLGSTAATHDDGDEIHTTLFFRSDTTEGTARTWTIQPWNTSMYATVDGLFYKYKDASPDPLTREGVASRVRFIYYYGYDTIPRDIIRLALIYAKKMMASDLMSGVIVKGRDEFKPEMFNVDEEEIKRIVGTYRVIPMGNT